MDLGVYELEFSGFNEVVEEVVNEDVFILKVKTMKVGDATSALLRPTPSGLEDLLYRKEYPMYHEVIESGMRCKIYVDVDCKLSKSAMKKYEYLFEKGRFYHNIRDIATSIISDVNIHLSSILPDIKAVWFVSSASDRVGGVISLHFTCNYGFEDISCVGHFINEVVFRKYDDMIDKGCYKKLQSMRTVLSYTDEKTRPLEPILNPNGLLKLSNYFITNLPKRRILPYKMPENHPKRAGNGTNSGVGKVNLDEIQEYLDLYPEKYYTDRNEWIKIGFSLGNLDKSDAMMDIFIKFSMKWKNFMVDERKHRRDAENLIEDATEDRKGGSYLWSARLKELEEMFPEKCKEIYSKYHLMPEKELNVIKLLPGSEYTFKMFRDQYSGKVIRDLKEPLGDMKKCIGIATNESESLVITIYENKIIVEDINKFTRNNKMYKVQLLCDKGRVREVSFPDLLSKNSPHLAYNNVVFSPGGLKNPKDFNLFTGFSGRLLGDSEYNPEKICKILWHIEHILMSGEKVSAEWFLDWLAHIVQHPEVKTRKVPIFVGKQQTGKSIIADMLINHIFGKYHAKSVQKIDHIAGPWNGTLENQIFIVLNEACESSGNKHDMYQILKTIVTDTTQTVQKKYQEARVYDDYCNIMVVTNNIRPVAIDLDDKRFEYFQVSDEKIDDHPYFNSLLLEIREAHDHFYTFLKKRKVKFENVKNGPHNDKTSEIKQLSVSEEVNYLISIVNEEAELPLKFAASGEDVIKPKTLYEEYCKKTGKTSSQKDQRWFLTKTGQYLGLKPGDTYGIWRMVEGVRWRCIVIDKVDLKCKLEAAGIKF